MSTRFQALATVFQTTSTHFQQVQLEPIFNYEHPFSSITNCFQTTSTCFLVTSARFQALRLPTIFQTTCAHITHFQHLQPIFNYEHPFKVFEHYQLFPNHRHLFLVFSTTSNHFRQHPLVFWLWVPTFINYWLFILTSTLFWPLLTIFQTTSAHITHFQQLIFNFECLILTITQLISNHKCLFLAVSTSIM